MLRFIFPVVLVAISLGLFLIVTNPIYKSTKALRIEEVKYAEALANANELEKRRDELVQRYNEFAASDVERLRKLLPDNVDNIRLILEIDYIASRYGMSLSNVNFEVDRKKDESTDEVVNEGGEALAGEDQDIASFELGFSVQAPYETFITFIKDLETSLRIVDIQSIQFDSTVSESKDFYKYDVKIKTYWLKN